MIKLDIIKEFADFTLRINYSGNQNKLAVFGASGAGKSTLLRIIAGLENPGRGIIEIAGNTVFDSSRGICLKPEDRNIGYVPQDGQLFPHLDVRKNLLYGFNRQKHQNQSIELDNVVSILELEPLLERLPSKLSGGEKQRVALGRALLSNPQLLLMDEPLAAIDYKLKRKIIPYLLKALKYFQIPIIYVSHSHEEVTQIADEIIVLNKGEVVAAGSFLEIIDKPLVYSEFSREGIDNSFIANIVSHDSREGFCLVEVEDTMFRIPPQENSAQGQINLSVKANEIILSLHKPEKISTRNILKGKVSRLAEVGKIILAHIDIGCQVLVELTPSAVNDLELKVGSELWVLIKTNSFLSGKAF